MDGHADSLNHQARVKTSGLHGATALPAVLPKRGDSSQEPQTTIDRSDPWSGHLPARLDRGDTVRLLLVIPTSSTLDGVDTLGIRWRHSAFDAMTRFGSGPTRAG